MTAEVETICGMAAPLVAGTIPFPQIILAKFEGKPADAGLTHLPRMPAELVSRVVYLYVQVLLKTMGPLKWKVRPSVSPGFY